MGSGASKQRARAVPNQGGYQHAVPVTENDDEDVFVAHAVAYVPAEPATDAHTRLCTMGFEDDLVTVALMHHSSDVDKALRWLCENGAASTDMVVVTAPVSTEAEEMARDYRLARAVISRASESKSNLLGDSALLPWAYAMADFYEQCTTGYGSEAMKRRTRERWTALRSVYNRAAVAQERDESSSRSVEQSSRSVEEQPRNRYRRTTSSREEAPERSAQPKDSGTDREQRLASLLARAGEVHEAAEKRREEMIKFCRGEACVAKETLEKVYLYFKEKVHSDDILLEAQVRDLFERSEERALEELVPLVLEVILVEEDELLLKQLINQTYEEHGEVKKEAVMNLPNPADLEDGLFKTLVEGARRKKTPVEIAVEHGAAQLAFGRQAAAELESRLASLRSDERSDWIHGEDPQPAAGEDPPAALLLLDAHAKFCGEALGGLKNNRVVEDVSGLLAQQVAARATLAAAIAADHSQRRAALVESFEEGANETSLDDLVREPLDAENPSIEEHYYKEARKQLAQRQDEMALLEATQDAELEDSSDSQRLLLEEKHAAQWGEIIGTRIRCVATEEEKAMAALDSALSLESADRMNELVNSQELAFAGDVCFLAVGIRAGLLRRRTLTIDDNFFREEMKLLGARRERQQAALRSRLSHVGQQYLADELEDWAALEEDSDKEETRLAIKAHAFFIGEVYAMFMEDLHGVASLLREHEAGLLEVTALLASDRHQRRNALLLDKNQLPTLEAILEVERQSELRDVAHAHRLTVFEAIGQEAAPSAVEEAPMALDCSLASQIELARARQVVARQIHAKRLERHLSSPRRFSRPTIRRSSGSSSSSLRRPSGYFSPSAPPRSGI